MDGDPYSQIQFLQQQVAQLTKELAACQLRGSVMEACLEGGDDKVVGKISAQGFLKKKGGGRIVGKDYERRWFILTPTHLRYFEEKGAIEVDKKIKVESKSSEPTEFTISHPNLGRKFEMRCNSSRERDRWVSAIQGKPQPAAGFDQKQRQNIEKECMAQRDVIIGLHAKQLDMLYQMMTGEKKLGERELHAKEMARKAAQELRDSDARMEEQRSAMGSVQAQLEQNIAKLEGKLEQETARKIRARMEACLTLDDKNNKGLLGIYKAKWANWVLARRKKAHTTDLEKAEQEHASLTGQVLSAQDNGERYMTAHAVTKKALIDVNYDVARLADELYYQEMFMHYSREEMKARFALQLRDLRKSNNELTMERDNLRANLQDTTERLDDTSERLHTATDKYVAINTEMEELIARAEVAAAFHMEAFALQARSIQNSTAQMAGGRVMASMSGWDKGGGHLWRRVYLWADGERGTLNYAHRDLRWGEIESIDLTKVTSVEVEGFWEYPPPDVPGHEHLGFYIEMNCGSKHRFCAETVVERSEWLDGLRGLVLTVCYPKPTTNSGSTSTALASRENPTPYAVQGGGKPIPPLPAHPGQHWGATEGGGVPAAAAASMVHGYRPSSPRRTRSVVTQATPAIPGTFTSPQRRDLDRQHPRAHKVTVLPQEYKDQPPFETPTNFFR